MVLNPPKLAVVMIGTNDLGADSACFASNASYSIDAVTRIYMRYTKIYMRYTRIYVRYPVCCTVLMECRNMEEGSCMVFL
jgi:hypothetical protein